MSLSKNIRYIRKKMGFSQDDIAEKLGYKSYTTIQKWEMGTSEPPLKKLKELADLFQVDMNDLANKDLTNLIQQNADLTAKSKYISSEKVKIDLSDFTQEELEEMRQFAAFIRQKRNNPKK